MSQVNFAAMPLDEAKHYFLTHRDDQEAFHAYMDKLQESGRAIVINPTNPESETAAIVQMQERLGIQKST
jgi:hypothetical protein